MNSCDSAPDQTLTIHIEFDWSYNVELMDGDGNPLGVTLADLHKRYTQPEKPEPVKISTQHADKDMQAMASMMNTNVESMIQEQTGLTPNQQKAISAAEEQAGRALTDDERQHVIAGNNDDDIQLDL